MSITKLSWHLDFHTANYDGWSENLLQFYKLFEERAVSIYLSRRQSKMGCLLFDVLANSKYENKTSENHEWFGKNKKIAIHNFLVLCHTAHNSFPGNTSRFCISSIIGYTDWFSELGNRYLSLLSGIFYHNDSLLHSHISCFPSKKNHIANQCAGRG